MVYTVNQLAKLAGVSVRTLHYYNDIGLLNPEFRGPNGYRQYGEKTAVRLQQIMFFRELDFSLDEIRRILEQPDFDVLEALVAHKILLAKKEERIRTLLKTVDKTISKLKGETSMEIKDYYQGFSDEQIEKYRSEVRRRWGDKTLRESEERVTKMGKEGFKVLQAEFSQIFEMVNNNMSKGIESEVIQEQVARWQRWLENFSHYPNEALVGLSGEYDQNPEFKKNFTAWNKEITGFFAQAVEYYCGRAKEIR